MYSTDVHYSKIFVLFTLVVTMLWELAERRWVSDRCGDVGEVGLGVQLIGRVVVVWVGHLLPCQL